MKMSDAQTIMLRGLRPQGYLVAFEWAKNGILETDHFPDVRDGETPIPTEAEAWDLASQFASKTKGRCVNIYVTHASDFTPVPGYRERLLENR